MDRPRRTGAASRDLAPRTPYAGSRPGTALRAAYSIAPTDSAPAGSRSPAALAVLAEACANDDPDSLATSMQRLNLQSAAGITLARGLTPLMAACRHDASRVARWVVQKRRAAVDDRDAQGNTALHHAAAAGSAACTDVLIEAHAQISAQNKEGATALHFATYHGRQQVIGRLLPALNTRDGTGKTPLMLAAFRGRTQAALALLGHGALVNVQDSRGWTALMYAAFAGRIVICRELLEAAASRAATDRSTGKSAADLARDAGYYEVADMLNNRCKELRTPSLPDGIRMPSLHL
ncbi:ATP-dependent RNA helicase, partial [Coemansia biformis]